MRLFETYFEFESQRLNGRKIFTDEFQELQRQNSRLCDTVAEMKKELKELKGEV